MMNGGMTQQEFVARITVGAFIEMTGALLAALQWTGFVTFTFFQAGLEEVTLLHLGVFLVVVGAGLQVKTALARAKEKRRKL
ncbi:MAG: hypothetical protein R3270_00450 [Gammaproteobacteria bacterium]|nr:hypothetical protein [Gammaproteobacteria bacterium]